MRTLTIAVLMLATATPAVATTPAKRPVPTAAQLKNANETLGLIVSALNDKGVPQETKNGLFGCLYENSLGKIAAGSAEVIAKNKPLQKADPAVRLMIISKICGAPMPVPVGAPIKGR